MKSDEQSVCASCGEPQDNNKGIYLAYSHDQTIMFCHRCQAAGKDWTRATVDISWYAPERSTHGDLRAWAVQYFGSKPERYILVNVPEHLQPKAEEPKQKPVEIAPTGQLTLWGEMPPPGTPVPQITELKYRDLLLAWGKEHGFPEIMDIPTPAPYCYRLASTFMLPAGEQKWVWQCADGIEALIEAAYKHLTRGKA